MRIFYTSSQTVPLIHLSPGYYRCRSPPEYKGKYYSLIGLGGCNFLCSYCHVGGFSVEGRGKWPFAIDQQMDDVKRFIKEENEKRHLIKITGGEPSMFGNEVAEMIDCAKSVGACSGQLDHRADACFH